MALKTSVVTVTAAAYVSAGTFPVAALQIRSGQQARVVIAAALPAVDTDEYFTLKLGDRLTLLPTLTTEEVYVRAELDTSKIAVISTV